jgi:hypothetical protein
LRKRWATTRGVLEALACLRHVKSARATVYLRRSLSLDLEIPPMKTTVRLGADSAGTVLMRHWPETFLAFSWPRWINRRTVSSVTPNILATCLTDRYVIGQLTPPQYNPLLKQMCGRFAPTNVIDCGWAAANGSLKEPVTIVLYSGRG